ncbi:cytochrome c oxidase assembly protein [Bacillus sp. Xin]|uniref:cytochrome c oxidase assembly protein n=1 Tax=unclassified Bacillus (in: firmicutes) TaxID=185979 RepID=UPI0015724E77|nr:MULTISPECIES: cytochrome c oxidase assembly protein [unclassified Bacillus (in: firmicutes)]MBC6972794.1 cytochrome c oxidase assembly protein [Bacillus sp. Xin]NSW37257.1 cytochrome c oxidase assembly protein [Bacillus sp. Xin1]
MNNDHIYHGDGNPLKFILLFLIAMILILYIVAVVLSSHRRKKWPLYRTTFWILGVLCAATALVGPLANRAHIDFAAHMLGHLFLGMLAPILMVLAAPMTLVLRTLNVKTARRLSSVLRSWPIRTLSDPIVATLLNLGGLWVLYTTKLYSMMHQNILLHLFVHFHVFIASYLFTISMIYIDPTPHKSSFIYRAIVLVIALASHGILSKYIYANPPNGIPTDQAQLGGMLMYYGGDAIDIILIFIFCLQWFKTSRNEQKYINQ